MGKLLLVKVSGYLNVPHVLKDDENKNYKSKCDVRRYICLVVSMTICAEDNSPTINRE